MKAFLATHGYALWLGAGCAFLLDSETITILRWEWWVVVVPIVVLVTLREHYTQKIKEE